MTPTQAYQAALEAAATIADGMKAPIQDAANIAIGLPAFSNTVAALIRALPVPEGLDDTCPRCAHAGGLDNTDAGGTKCRFCGWRNDENTVPASGVPKRSFPDAADGSPSLPMEPELWAAGCDLETARFVARQLAAGGYTLTESDELDRLRAENERLRGMSPGVAAIAAERQRQITEEGWTAEHDDAHVRGELGAAAACYAVPSRHRLFAVANFWPSTWGHEWWKPSGAHDDIEARRRDLVKAGALIAAEIDRLDRDALKGGE